MAPRCRYLLVEPTGLQTRPRRQRRAALRHWARALRRRPRGHPRRLAGNRRRRARICRQWTSVRRRRGQRRRSPACSKPTRPAASATPGSPWPPRSSAGRAVGDLLDRVPGRRPLAPLPVPGGHRLPRLLPAGGDRRLPAGPRPGPRAGLAPLDGRPDRGAGDGRAGRGADLRVRRRPHHRHADPGRDHPRLSDRRHPHAGPRRRRRRPHPLAPRPDLVAAARSASRPWSSPTSPTRCRPPTPACPAATGSNRST